MRAKPSSSPPTNWARSKPSVTGSPSSTRANSRSKGASPIWSRSIRPTWKRSSSTLLATSRNSPYEYRIGPRGRGHQGIVSAQGLLRPLRPDRRHHAGDGVGKLLPRHQERRLREGHRAAADVGFRAGDRHRNDRPPNPRRARESHHFPVAGQAGDPLAGDSRQVRRVLAVLWAGADCPLPLLWSGQRLPRTPLAAVELLSGALAAMGHAGRGRGFRAVLRS